LVLVWPEVVAQVAMTEVAVQVALDQTEVATQVAMDLNRRIQEEEEYQSLLVFLVLREHQAMVQDTSMQ
jgi:hypothetical protein